MCTDLLTSPWATWLGITLHNGKWYWGDQDWYHGEEAAYVPWTKEEPNVGSGVILNNGDWIQTGAWWLFNVICEVNACPNNASGECDKIH